MPERIRPHMYYVITTNLCTGQFFIANYNTKRDEPVSYDVAETRLAKLPPRDLFSADLISVEEFNRRFERKG